MTTASESIKVWLVTYQYNGKGGNGVGNFYHRNKDESEFISHERLMELQQWVIDYNGLNEVIITGIYRLADEFVEPPEEAANG
ncbi:TPA: hypothetical protein ACPWK4_000709 [Yersinia enterocolitica]|uniref:hypothetical protein n=1 Tax=Yersinia enterocolitica TaxID=630 RepID=UPI0005E0EA9F|nr:hypothetical protein [Yersinia enterocolitica]EKN4914803.1 hypothetical protein [Yersinia enterocolitica]EKN5130154.1 hypothetical protein [Yersinia enterocolitica]ELI8151059.1 hypothetical protein [Yersinia enterocolitica]ELZ0587182.1 hypothetical protein [Yersinia enterocolitica]UYK03321.1 hypothetical protein N4221_07825 [Yersinia enterocolitica]